MATPENEEVPLLLLLQELRAGEAKLQKGTDGKLQIVYENERTIPLSHVDRSKAHAIQVGRNADDVQLRVDVCLEMIEAIKQSRAPSGVVVDKSKVGVSALGQYKEGRHFERLTEVLGKGNCAGDIAVVKDNKTGTEHAVKTVMISEFSTDEVRAWVDLGESDHFPSLYLFRLEDSKVVLHMEKVEHGVTLDEIIDSHMMSLRQNDPNLTRPFSMCIFHGLLSAIREMHDKNWTHRDLHGGNVMITKDSMDVKVLDFGMARPLRGGLTFNHDGLKKDILSAVRLFCGLYIGQDFGNNFCLENLIKDGSLKKVLAETSFLKQQEREELWQLIMMTYQVTSNPQQAGYGSTTPVMEHIEQRLFPEKKKDVMRKAAAILFPDFYKTAKDISLRGGGEEVVDGAVPAAQMGDMADDVNLEEAAQAIPEDFLQQLSIGLPTSSSPSAL